MAFSVNSGKVAIPKLDRGPPPPPRPTPAQNREDRVYVFYHYYSKYLGHIDNLFAVQEPVRTVANEVSLLPACNWVTMLTVAEVKCSGDIPRCTNCQTNSIGCVYEQSRRDRLKEYVK